MQGEEASQPKKKKPQEKELSSWYLYSSPNSVLPAWSWCCWQRQTCCLSSRPGQGRENHCWRVRRGCVSSMASYPLSVA